MESQCLISFAIAGFYRVVDIGFTLFGIDWVLDGNVKGVKRSWRGATVGKLRMRGWLLSLLWLMLAGGE